MSNPGSCWEGWEPSNSIICFNSSKFYNQCKWPIQSSCRPCLVHNRWHRKARQLRQMPEAAPTARCGRNCVIASRSKHWRPVVVRPNDNPRTSRGCQSPPSGGHGHPWAIRRKSRRDGMKTHNLFHPAFQTERAEAYCLQPKTHTTLGSA